MTGSRMLSVEGGTQGGARHVHYVGCPICSGAALREERDRYREALENIADTNQWLSVLGKTPGQIAREALMGAGS